MHEMALTSDIVCTVIREAKAAHASRVNAVHLTIGYARDIVEDLFEKCFSYLTRDTMAQDAALVVERVPVVVCCRECGTCYPISLADDSTLACPACHARRYELQSGLEFTIDRIEVA